MRRVFMRLDLLKDAFRNLRRSFARVLVPVVRVDLVADDHVAPDSWMRATGAAWSFVSGS